MQRILLALLVFSAGFAVTGVLAAASVVGDENVIFVGGSPSVLSVSEGTLVLDASFEYQLEVPVQLASKPFLESGMFDGLVSVGQQSLAEAEYEDEKDYDKEVEEEYLPEIEITTDDFDRADDNLAQERLKPILNEVHEKTTRIPTVPFFSQFTDITPANWKKVSCGIASVAMLIDYYKPGQAAPDVLLQQGISAGAFLTNAGWTHAGLINLSKQFGLDGQSYSLAEYSRDKAFLALVEVLEGGPVMVSVHYTFEPTNPIPHLVVVNGVQDGLVYYNDPAEEIGGGSISIEKFQKAWKQRYIEIRPVS